MRGDETFDTIGYLESMATKADTFNESTRKVFSTAARLLRETKPAKAMTKQEVLAKINAHIQGLIDTPYDCYEELFAQALRIAVNALDTISAEGSLGLAGFTADRALTGIADLFLDPEENTDGQSQSRRNPNPDPIA